MDKSGKELTVMKESFFDKIKQFFKKLFSKKEENVEQTEIKKENDFLSRVKIEEDNEEKRLLKLQSLLAEEIIAEEELPDDDIKALHELYNKQILQLKREIDEYRQKTLKLRMNKQE